MIVVSDTSPLNYLVLTEHEQLLPQLFGQVFAPPAVMMELQHGRAPQAVQHWAANPPDWLRVQSPTTCDRSLDLGPGEAEAISLARELRADAVRIDERRAAAAARGLGLFVAGTLGVLAIASEKRLIRIGDAIRSLRATSFRLPEWVVDDLLAAERRRDGAEC